MKVFISHAQLEKKVANDFSKLLSTAFNISASDIFCSSVPGQGIPAGVLFVEHIRAQLEEADLVFFIISANYLDSEFCIAEMGGTWVSQKEYIPFKLPSVKYDGLKATLTGIQVSKLDDESDVIGIRDKIEHTFPEHRFPRIELTQARIEDFVGQLKRTLPKIPKPQNIPRSELDAEVRKATVFKDDIKELRAKINEKDSLIKQLEAAKDAVEVRQIRRANSNEDEKYETALKAFRSAYHKITPIVARALYYTLPETGEFWPDGSAEHVEAQDAAETKLFNRAGGFDEYQLNLSHPRVRAAKAALTELDSFLRDVSAEWRKDYEAEHDYTLELSNREFYESLVEW